MSDNEGMLFLFPYESIRAFTTIGMKFPIDLIFFDSSFTVIGILKNVLPEEKSLLFPIPILGALEIKSSDKSPKIGLGDKILFVDFSYKPYTKLRDAKQILKKQIAALEDKLRKVKDEDKGVFGTNLGLAYIYLQKADFQKAKDSAEKALSINNHDPTALNLYGTALINLKMNDKAKDVLERAVLIKPDYGAPYINLYNLYLLQNKMDEAKKVLLKALTSAPDYLPLYNKLCFIYLKSEETKKCSEMILNARKKGFDFPEFNKLMGDILLRSGDYSGAALKYKSYLVNRRGAKDSGELQFFIRKIGRASCRERV